VETIRYPRGISIQNSESRILKCPGDLFVLADHGCTFVYIKRGSVLFSQLDYRDSIDQVLIFLKFHVFSYSIFLNVSSKEVRFRIDRPNVTSSAYSRSSPMATPLARVEMVTGKPFSLR